MAEWNQQASRILRDLVLALESLKDMTTQTFDTGVRKGREVDLMAQNASEDTWAKYSASSETALLAYPSPAESNCDRADDKAPTSLLWPFLSFGCSNGGDKDLGQRSTLKF